jgi:hypothetical protein
VSDSSGSISFLFFFILTFEATGESLDNYVCNTTAGLFGVRGRDDFNLLIARTRLVLFRKAFKSKEGFFFISHLMPFVSVSVCIPFDIFSVFLFFLFVFAVDSSSTRIILSASGLYVYFFFHLLYLISNVVFLFLLSIFVLYRFPVVYCLFGTW